MATGKKKTILMYFLQKTSGTYSESSLAFLQELLRREGIISGVESVQTTAGELASFVADGSYLKVSTKKIPEHIRAQIDFHLQKSRRNSKKSSSTSSASAFDELLASIDSDDPKFSMDTTLGLDFSSLEELESDLKKHALDSLSPSIFAKERRGVRRAQTFAGDLSNNYVPESSDDFADVEDVYSQSKVVSQLENSPDTTKSNVSDLHLLHNDITSEMLSAQQKDIQHGVPDFPNSNQIPAQVISHNQQHFVPAHFSFDLNAANKKAEQQQMFAELQLRASLIDAKERLLSSKISSSNDPAVLKAISMLDEKLLQFAQQQNENKQTVVTSPVHVDNGVLDSNFHLTADLQGKSQSSKSLSAQIKSYVQEIMGAQKSLNELGQVFAASAQQSARSVQPATVEQVTPAQVREMAKQEKHEVTKLRSQLSNLQEQFSQLSAQIVAAQQPVLAAQNFRGRIKPMKTTAIHHNEINSQLVGKSNLQSKSLVAPQRQLVEPESFGSDFVGEESVQSNVFESDTPTLQKMYALLAVGMRELNISPQRARHIYEQLQRLYATLSFDQKPIIYPSIVEFYASLSNQMRGVQ